MPKQKKRSVLGAQNFQKRLKISKSKSNLNIVHIIRQPNSPNGIIIQ